MITGGATPSDSPVPDPANWSDSAVREHFMRLARVARSTASAVIITDAAGVTTWVNDGFTQITGYGLNEAVGCKPGDLLQGPETDRDMVARIAAALRSNQSVAAELINYAKDGRRYWVGMKIEPLFASNGELEGFMAIEADITERQEERQTIERLTRHFDVATRAARVGVFERDATFEIVWWSEMMWEIFGQDPSTFVPSNEAWLQLIHPDDLERIRQEVQQFKQELAAVNMQYRIIRPDGELRHIQSIGAPAELQNGSVQRVGGITLDVTERVHAKEREQALQAQLRESSHRAGMAEIATGVLHNVGNVLNSLGIANSTAQRELKASRFEQLQQATALLRNNRETLAAFLTSDERGRHLPDYLPALSAQVSLNSRAVQAELATTEQLLNHLNDIISAQQELARIGGQYEYVHLSELIETALLVQSADLAQIEVTRAYEDLPPVSSDRHKLLQILVNLISNARDAIEAGAGGRGRISLKLAREGDLALLTVEDSGTGMSPDVLARLWQFGFTTKKDGHGFGLHNSANAAHEIGATLSAHSDGIGQGSRFILSLPISDSHQQYLLSGATV